MAEVWDGQGWSGVTEISGKRVTIKEIKREYRIEDVLGVPLEPDGSRRYSDWRSIKCPFHKDSRASASFNPKVQRFKCHGCEVAGDLIDIVTQTEDCDAKEAMTWIQKNLPRRHITT